uniref:Glycine receptor subunit alpha-2-like isoform X3 n=1 Tax=Petromyzon marinus TaxID=7757 RepID=A0AAJ7UIW5_PETMA|nr:glycine receptor subunit alpha-2-like isoform X3 [Petromyzon marinus]
MTIFLVRKWRDGRLKLRRKAQMGEDHMDMPDEAVSLLWRPSVFFDNEKDSVVHSVTAPNSMLKIYNDSRVLLSMRITLTLSCPMDITDFPRDSQICPLTITSASYTANEMFLQWDEKERGIIHKDIKNLQFELENIILYNNCTNSEIMAPARVSIGVATTISMATQCTSAHANMPKVPYMTSMDHWLSFCFIFIITTFTVSILQICYSGIKNDISTQRAAGTPATTPPPSPRTQNRQGTSARSASQNTSGSGADRRTSQDVAQPEQDESAGALCPGRNNERDLLQNERQSKCCSKMKNFIRKCYSNGERSFSWVCFLISLGLLLGLSWAYFKIPCCGLHT